MSSSKAKEGLSSFDDMTFIYQCFLKIIRILPFDNFNFTHPLSRLHMVYCFIFTSIYWSMFVFYMINEKKLPEVATLCEVIVVLGVIIRYYILTQRRQEFAKLFDESRAIWQLCDDDGHRTVHQFEQKIRLVFKVLLCSSSITVIIFSITAISMTVNAILHNHTDPRRLPFKWYSDNGPNLWPGYKIIFTLQFLTMENGCIIASAIDAVGPLLIMIAAGYFRALRHRILRIAVLHDEQPSVINLELVACVQLHQRIFNFCSSIEKITRSLFFVQLSSSVYVISLVGIKLAGTDPDRLKYMPFITSMLTEAFICQWAPDHLMEESTAISTAAYSVSITWMRLRLGKLFVLIIARSQKPVQMTAAGFVNLSLENFASMLTSAVSFFTVLRNFNI